MLIPILPQGVAAVALAAWEAEEAFNEQVREARLALPREAVGKTRPQRVIFPMDLAGKECVPWWKVAPDIERVTAGRYG